MDQPLEDLDDHLATIGVHNKATNPGPVSLDGLQDLLPRAVESARQTMQMTFESAAAAAEQRLQSWTARATGWTQLSFELTQRAEVKKQRERVTEEQLIAESLAPAQRLVRPLLIVVPRDTPTAVPEGADQ
ncbi:hypothetical protein AB0N33_08690 [Pseudarthrobacter oxydans]|uniref:hypothetical protein n=1 Tax=Pseudarthrobacter oxydans TaxID=1671 RepID=UPI0034400DC6